MGTIGTAFLHHHHPPAPASKDNILPYQLEFENICHLYHQTSHYTWGTQSTKMSVPMDPGLLTPPLKLL